VLGSKAGRERYEQIKRLSARTVDHPAVQGAAGFVRAKLSAALSAAYNAALRRNRQVQPDMAYLDEEALLVDPAGTPARLSPIHS
jgi:hypothetical protein